VTVENLLQAMFVSRLLFLLARVRAQHFPMALYENRTPISAYFAPAPFLPRKPAPAARFMHSRKRGRDEIIRVREAREREVTPHGFTRRGRCAGRTAQAGL